jgi:uncharacterized protein
VSRQLDEDGLVIGASDTIATFSGGWIRPLDPDPEDICIEDIAHALSSQCRFTGHTRRFYSVGEHAVLCSRIVPEGNRLEALLHDGSEAYLADLARPVKHAPGLGETYRAYEARLERAIALRFGTTYPMSDAVRAADEAMLSSEIHALMPAEFSAMRALPPVETPVPQCWSPVRAEMEFLEAYTFYTRRKR